MNKIIEFNNMSYSYNDEGQDFIALKNINLEIKRGEFIAILGPSGCGKSTLLNIIGLLTLPTTGSYKLVNEEVSNLIEEECANLRNQRIGFVFQQFNLLSRLSVLENILLPVSFNDNINFIKQRKIKYEVDKLLNDFNLIELKNRFPNEMSGGQRQRISIIRSLLQKPDLILADEPTGALDAKTTSEVLDIFENLNKQGKTIIIITHDPIVAGRTKRQIHLKDGEIIKDIKNSENNFADDNNNFLTPTSYWQFFLSTIFNIIPNFLLAIRTLGAHKLRSSLTGLGLLVGIIGISFVSGLGEISERAFNKLFLSPATQKVYIRYESNSTARNNRKFWRGLDPINEFPKIAEKFAEYGKVRPFYTTETCTINSESKNIRARFQGFSDSEEFYELDTPLNIGRFPTNIEVENGTDVVILGNSVVNSLFSHDYIGRNKTNFPIGEKIITSYCGMLRSFKIIGVLSQQDSTFGRTDANDTLYASTWSLINAGGEKRFKGGLSVLPNKGVDPRWIGDSVANFMSLRMNGEASFTAMVPAEMLDKILSMLKTIQILTGGIGALCIIVGGIGIMNIMLVSVKERIKEIGLCKSLGAKPSHLKQIIVIESLTLCIISGVLGIIIGVIFNNIVAFLAAHFFPQLGAFAPVWAISGLVTGLIVSIITGLIFGYYPASVASRMDAATCLREE